MLACIKVYWILKQYIFKREYTFDFILLGFPGGSEGKVSACNVGELVSIPGLGRSPGEGNGNPLQYSCLENSMDGGAWVGYSSWGRKELDMTEQLHSLILLTIS